METGLRLADPAGALKVLADAAEDCIKTYGSINVKWGDVFRFGSGEGDFPGNGGSGNSGVSGLVAYTCKIGDRYYAAHGETLHPVWRERKEIEAYLELRERFLAPK